MHGGAQPGSLAVALHDLLYPADRVRSAPLRLEQMHLLRVGRKVCPEDQAEGLWKQNVAVLAPFALVDEDLALGEIKVGHLNVHQLTDPNRCEEQQLEHDFMLDAAFLAHGLEEASEFLGRQQVGQPLFAFWFTELQLLAGQPADGAEFVIAQVLLPGQSDELRDHFRFRLLG